MRLTLEKKIISGFIGALFLLVIIAYLSYQSTKHLTENAALAEHTQKVLASLESLMSDLTDVEAGERGFVITGQASYLDPYEQNIIESAVSFRRLRELTADNPAQQRRLDTLALLLAARLDAARLVVEVRRTHGFTAAQREILTGKGKRLHDEIRGLITDMKQEENNLLQKREEKTKSSSQSTQTVIVLGSLGAILLVGAALFIISRGFNQLKQAEEMLLRKNQELRVATERAQAADHIK